MTLSGSDRTSPRAVAGWLLPIVAWIFAGLAAIVFLEETFIALPSSNGPSNSQNWPYAVEAFYQQASEQILSRAGQTHASCIALDPEVYPGNWIISSPCNLGLANAIRGKQPQNSSAILAPVVYYEQPLYASDIGRGIIDRIAPFLRGRSGWFDAATGNSVVTPSSDGTLHVVLGVEQFSITDTTTARLSIRCVGSTEPLLSRLVVTPTTHLNWFARPRLHRAGAQVCLIASALLWILVALFWTWEKLRLWLTRRSGVDPAVNAGLLFALVGQLCVLLLLVLLPLDRLPVTFNDRKIRLHFVIDANSGVMPGESMASVGPDKAGIAEFALEFEKHLQGQVIASQDRFTPFWTWLVHDALHAIDTPEDFSLAGRFDYLVRLFTGTPDDRWQQWEKDTFWRSVRSMLSDAGPRLSETIRGPRLVDPTADLQTGQESDGVRNAWVILTPGAPANADDGRSFDRQMAHAPVDPSDVKVILAPWFPLSASEARRDEYEEYRVRRMRQLGDVIDLNSAPVPDLPSPQASRGQLITLTHPMYKLPDLGSRDQEQWDVPSALTLAQRDRLWVSRDTAVAAADEIVARLSNWLNPPGRGPSANNITSFTLGHNTRMMLALLGLSALLGFAAFARERDKSSVLPTNFDRLRRILREELSARMLAATGVLLLLIFGTMRLIWQTQWPQITTAVGTPALAIATLLLCWQAWVFAPHVAFVAGFVRAKYGRGLRVLSPAHEKLAGINRRDLRLSFLTARGFASIITLLCALGAITIFFSLPQQWSGAPPIPIAARLAASCALLFAPLLLMFLQPGGGRTLQHAAAHRNEINRPAWWSRFRWSLLVKAILAGGLVVLARGAFPATPGQAGLPLLAAFTSTFHGFVLFVASTWTVMALAVIGLSTDPGFDMRRRVIFCSLLAVPMIFEIAAMN